MITKSIEYLLSTGDKADRTSDILSQLTANGICHLSTGDFYVNNLIMPENSTLIGCGAATRLILSEDVSDGFTVEIQTRCTIKDLSVNGSTKPIEISETVGTRHGIIFQSETPKDDLAVPQHGTIDNCHIAGFQGGGITCFNTGYSFAASLNVSNCWIENCDAGIHIPYWSEYHRFTNVAVMFCWYGCINNGGNNMFANCGFNGNNVGFLIDNSTGKSKNNSHGAVSCCTFNHSGNNNGIGIMVLNASHGYVFSNCQVFYSKIIVENTDGVLFDSFNFGNLEKINVTGGKAVKFMNCMFTTPPVTTIEDNTDTQFINCFARKTGEPITI